MAEVTLSAKARIKVPRDLTKLAVPTDKKSSNKNAPRNSVLWLKVLYNTEIRQTLSRNFNFIIINNIEIPNKKIVTNI